MGKLDVLGSAEELQESEKTAYLISVAGKGGRQPAVKTMNEKGR